MTQSNDLKQAAHPVSHKVRRPSLLKLALEARTFFEAGSFALSFPLLQTTAKGDGHPIMVMPGFLANDFSTKLLRTFLKSRGYKAYGWKLGRNLGKQSHPETGCGEDVIARLEEIYHKHGRKVSIIGWSLGGIYARELAKLRPEMTRQVITLGSPFNGNLKANHASKLFQKTSGYSLSEMDKDLRKNMPKSPPVPTTSIYSKSDGITAWQCCLEIADKTTQNIEVSSSHCGLGHHPFVMWVIADRLAQDEDNWQLFEPKLLEKLMFLV
ncbi:MAG TPA: alpha/beta hydrolase [Oceanospirillales bacterium]|nr:alpha/beta hydrolase [Oceanospirillales bacterium]